MRPIRPAIRRLLTPAESPGLILLFVNPLLLLPMVSDPAVVRWMLFSWVLLVSILRSPLFASRLSARAVELWPLVGLAGLVAFGLFRGALVAEAARLLALLAAGALAYLWGRSLNSRALVRSLGLLVSSATVIAVYSLLQAFSLDILHYSSESWMYRVVTTFGHRNFTAVYLLTALIVAIGLDRDRPGSRRFPFQALVIYLGLLATAARFPIAFATLTLLAAFLSRKRLQIAALAGAGALFGWLVFLVASGQHEEILTRTETFGIRDKLYRASAVLATEQPVLGQGPGAFVARIPAELARVWPQRPSHLVFLHTHNLPLEITIESGVAGLVLFLLFLAPAYRGTVRNRAGPGRYLLWAHVGWWGTNLYDVNYFAYAGWVAFWPLLGMLRSTADGPVRAVASSAPHRWGRASSWTLLTGLVLLSSVLPLMAASGYLTRRAYRLAARGEETQASTTYLAASSLWPLHLDERYRAAVTHLQGGQVSLGTRQLQSIESQAPGFSAVRFNLAMGLAQLGRYEEASQWLDRHLEFYPQDMQAQRKRQRLNALMSEETRAPAGGAGTEDGGQSRSEAGARSQANGDPGED